MMKAFAIALVLALGCTAALAEDDDHKVSEADMAKVTAALADLGCKDPRGQEATRGHLRDRQCQVQDGHHGHQARQGLLGHSYFALLGTPLVARNASSAPPRSEWTDQRTGRISGSSFFFCRVILVPTGA